MKKEMLILAAAVIMGIAAVVYNQIHRESFQNKLNEQVGSMTAVATLRQDTPPGAEVQEGWLQDKQVPTNYVQIGYVPWDQRSTIVGQTLRVPVRGGQILVWNDFSQGSGKTVGDAILPGRALVTIPIDNLGSAAGMIQPGSRVDILAVLTRLPASMTSGRSRTAREGDDAGLIESMLTRLDAAGQAGQTGNDGFFLVTVARNLNVFAVGNQTQFSGGVAPGGYSTMSFDVPAERQALLLLANEYARRDGGRLFCVLRSNETTSAQEELDAYYSSADLFHLLQRENRVRGVEALPAPANGAAE